ncbi:MAG: DUF309 domain-containing protein [Bryobacteraceae bacterium]|nr:DUF309 domain-containing protein [Bryobacteraceae bacterium]
MVHPADHLARGFALFESGRYFEAHEEFEAAWNAAPRTERFFLQGLVHWAAAHHHASRGNFEGAVLQARRAMRKLAGYLPEHRGVDTRGLLAQLETQARTWQGCASVPQATIGVRR